MKLAVEMSESASADQAGHARACGFDSDAAGMRPVAQAQETGHKIPRKVDVFGVGVSVVDYGTAADAIITAAKERRSFSATALAVHGLITSVMHHDLLAMVNAFDLVCPDGQPVRWAMNVFHQTHLSEHPVHPVRPVESHHWGDPSRPGRDGNHPPSRRHIVVEPDLNMR